MKVDVSYVTTLPKIANAPYVKVNSNIKEEFRVVFMDLETGESVVRYGESNIPIYSNWKQYFTKWDIKVYNKNDALILHNLFDPTGKVIFIKIDGYALGDNISWIPFVEEFRKKWNCQVICSTFWNDIFIDAYPKIMFIKPNSVIHNVYAQYYIGASDDGNLKYSPIKSKYSPLQKIASSILGLNDMEIKPYVSKPLNRTIGKYVCISEFGSSSKKNWKGNWQIIVDYLKSIGYDVLVISKEKTSLRGVIDKTGDILLDNRIEDLNNCSLFIGVSSGLSWLAWSVGCPVFIISDVTPFWHEFSCIRVGDYKLQEVNYDNLHISSEDDVINRLSLFFK